MSNLLVEGLGAPQQQIFPPAVSKTRSLRSTLDSNDEWYVNQRATDMLNATTIVRAAPESQKYFVIYEQPRIARNFAEELRSLQQHYVLLDRDLSQLLGDDPALYSLLIEAIEPLRRAFGENRIVHARTRRSDEEALLKVAVQIPLNFDDPERALRSFDEAWWLNNCHRSGGSLVFDYELQDAV